MKRGIVTERTSTAARPISVSSTLPIGLVVLSSVVAEGVYGFDSPKQAVDLFKDIADTGNGAKYLRLGQDTFNLIVPTIVSVAKKHATAGTQKANVIKAINRLKTASSVVGFKPDVVVVANDGFDVDVINATISVCDAIKARSFVDLNATSNGEAITRRGSFDSDRITVAKCPLGIFNVVTSVTDFYDAGVMLGWLRCSVDGGSSVGFSHSISNRSLLISSVKSPSEFYAGNPDETDPLTEKQIMSFIHYKGFRSWEYATCSSDAIWQDARRVRIFDLAAAAVLDGVFFAVDKDISALASAKDSLRAFMNDLVGDNVMAGFKVYLDTERTTETRITAGEFYFVIEAQEMPSPRLIHITFNKVDDYSSVIYKQIKG